MPQLDPSTYTSQLFWLIVCFFSMLFIMSKFIIPQIKEITEQRQRKIDDNLNQAQSIKEKAELSLQKYEKALNEATIKANQSIEKTQKELKDFIDKKQAELADHLTKKIEEGEAKINQSKLAALKEVEAISGGLAVDVAKKIGLKDIKEKDIEEAIKTLKAS